MRRAADLMRERADDAARVLVIAQPVTRPMVEKLRLKGQVAIFDGVAPEPADSDLDAAIDAARAHRPELIVGLGGGAMVHFLRRHLPDAALEVVEIDPVVGLMNPRIMRNSVVLPAPL